MTLWTDDDSHSELEADLRADAQSWQASPSPRATERLQNALSGAPSRTTPARWRRAVPLAAAALLVSVAFFAFRESTAKDRADAPLQQELGRLADDVDALADAFWQQLPATLRRLRTN